MRTAEALIVTPFSRSRSIVSSTWDIISRSAMVPVICKETIRKGGFPVVNMGNDAEVADELLIHRKSPCSLAPVRAAGALV